MAPTKNYPTSMSPGVKTNGVNGTTNGVNGTSPSSITSSPKTSRHRVSYSFRSSGYGNTGESSTVYQALEKKGSAELGYGVFESISRTSFIDLVEYIGTERLTSLPHKGSKWDKVLIRALYFAEQQHGFEKMMKSFGLDDNNLAYGYCKMLLEVRHLPVSR